jgi:putative flippase GtrA
VGGDDHEISAAKPYRSLAGFLLVPVLPLAQRWDSMGRGSASAAIARLGSQLHHLERVPQVVRFLFVGGFCALLQVAILFLLVNGLGLQHNLSNILAIVAATQVNFVLSSVITWRDRLPSRYSRSILLRRWSSYNGMAVTTLLVNGAVFAIADRFLHYLAAGALGILAAAALNYTASRHLVFPRRDGEPAGPLALAGAAPLPAPPPER